MKALMAAASAVLVFALPAVASAQTDSAPAGVYANLGYANTHSEGVDLGAIGGRLGYRFNNWLGVEGELAIGVKKDHVSSTVGGATVRGKAKLSHAEAIYGVGFLPLTPNWELIGRVGYGHAKVKISDVTVVGPGGAATGISASDDGDSWNFGLGAQYHWDGANGIRADYTRQEFTHGGRHGDVWAISYSHRF